MVSAPNQFPERQQQGEARTTWNAGSHKKVRERKMSTLGMRKQPQKLYVLYSARIPRGAVEQY